MSHTNLAELHQPPGSAPGFTAAEYGRRLAAVRQAMEREGIDLLLSFNPANVSYLTGYDTAAPSSHAVALVAADGPVAVQVPDLQVASLRMTAPDAEVISYTWLSPDRSPADQLAGEINDRGFGASTIGVELGRIEPYGGTACDARTWEALVRLLPEADFSDASGLVLEVRSRKSDEELDAIRRAGELTAVGLEASLNRVEEGATDQEIVAAAESAMWQAGSEISANVPICTVGATGGWGPMPPTLGTRVEIGDPAHFEYSGISRRYCAPAMRTAVLGSPGADIGHAAETTLNTLEVLISAIRPGRTGHDIAMDAAKAMAAREPDLWWHGGFGYSIGLGMQPTWTEAPVYIAEGSETVIERGMAFHLPIVLVKPGRFTVGFSETVIARDGAAEVATRQSPLELRVVEAGR